MISLLPYHHVLGVTVNLPPGLRGKKQFTEEECVTANKLSSARVHVERVISYYKDWRCLSEKPNAMLYWASTLVHVCGFLTNLQPVHLGEMKKKLIAASVAEPGPSGQNDQQ